jgi:hypothetical protein
MVTNAVSAESLAGAALNIKPMIKQTIAGIIIFFFIGASYMATGACHHPASQRPLHLK